MLGSPIAHDALSAASSSAENAPRPSESMTSGSVRQTSIGSTGGHQSSTNDDEPVVGRDDLGELGLTLLQRTFARDLAPQRVDERGGRLVVGAVALAARQQLAADALEVCGLEPQDVVLVEVAELGRRARQRRSGGAADERRHTRGALGSCGDRLVVASSAQAIDDLAERSQRHAGLAEARQDAFDVVHEHRRRADDEHAAGLETTAIGVEKVGRAVQGHDGLAGAGSTADRGGATAGSADGFVLLLLDRGDDRVHRAVAGAAQAGEQRAFADDDQIVGGVVGIEQVVLDADDLLARAAQHATADDAGRILGGGLIEHGGSWCAPVDDDDVTVLVAYADATDVAGLSVEQVEPTEHESVVGGIERGDALGRLEDHGVALDEAAFVANVAARIALGDERLSHLARRFEPLVDVVDVGLFGSDFLLSDVLSAVCRHPSPFAVCRTHKSRRWVIYSAGGSHMAGGTLKWLLLAEERSHRLAGLVAAEQRGRLGRDLVAERVDTGDQVVVEELLGLAQTLRVALDQVAEYAGDVALELGVGHSAGDQADASGFGRIELAGRQEQVGRRTVGEPREQRQRDDGSGESEAYLGELERHRLTGDHDVGSTDDAEATSAYGPAELDDDWLVEGRDLALQGDDRLGTLDHPVSRRLREVSAGAEHRAGRADQHGLHLSVRARRRQVRHQLA